MTKKIWVLALVFLLFTLGPTRAEKMEVPLDLQVSLILKSLSFDRALRERAGEELKIGVLWLPRVPDSRAAKDDLSAILGGYAHREVEGLPITYKLIEYSSSDKLKKEIGSGGVDLLYITPGNMDNIAAITQVTQRLKLLTVTGIVGWVDKGVSLGIGLKEGKPQIVVNLESSKAEGVDFDARFLRLAKVIKGSTPQGENSSGEPEAIPFLAYDTPPRLIKRVLPKYPEIAREAKAEGMVILRLLVDEKGNVVEAKVLKGDKNFGFEEAAIEAALKCKFTPAYQREKPVKVWVSFPVAFSLKKRR